MQLVALLPTMWPDGTQAASRWSTLATEATHGCRFCNPVHLCPGMVAWAHSQGSLCPILPGAAECICHSDSDWGPCEASAGGMQMIHGTDCLACTAAVLC